MPKKIHLVIIDPQRSFCATVPAADQQRLHDGELCVPNGWDDMCRVGNLVYRLIDVLDEIKITLDSHHKMHIAHPGWYKDNKGNKPAPFTSMREEKGRIIGSVFNASTNSFTDVGEYTTVVPSFLRITLDYLKALATGGRYPHVIWPEHCLIGTPGHTIVEPLAEALFAWEDKNHGWVEKVTKGSWNFCEHFSAVKAEVPAPREPSTQLNTEFITTLMVADEILLSGEARSHCLANTVRDMANQFTSQGDALIKKCVLLTDATSDVPGFEKYGEDFVAEMIARGMRTSTCKDYLA